ncbi:MAG: hypothetical protein RR585_08560 [Coprobacillus sp.]
MPIKIDIQTNINDGELTIETCAQIITILQESYKNIRKDMYNHFLGKKNLYRSLIFAGIIFMFYFLSKDTFYIYLMPLSVIFAMISSIISAEYITSQTKKQIQNQIQHYIDKKNKLLKEKELKV